RARRRAPSPSPWRSSRAQLLEHDGVDLLDSVDPFLEILGAGPARERRFELALVAEPGEAVAQLRCESVVDRQPLLARCLPEDRGVEPVEPSELGDGLRV